MIRFHAVANDLSIVFKNYTFKNKYELIKILESFFRKKFNDFLILTEKEKDLLKRQKMITKFLNDNAFFPIKDYSLTYNSIIGLKSSFISEYNDFIFDAIPNSLKKELTVSFSSLPDKKIFIFDDFLFYNYLSSFSLNYDKNMNFLLNGFKLNLEDIPSNLQYIFNSSSSEFISPRTEIKTVIPLGTNLEFANIKILFYTLLSHLFSEHKKFFNREWKSLFYNVRHNSETRFIFQNKKEIKEEITSRSFQNSFFKDNVQTKNSVLSKINNSVLYEDILNLLKFLKSTLKHLD